MLLGIGDVAVYL